MTHIHLRHKDCVISVLLTNCKLLYIKVCAKCINEYKQHAKWTQILFIRVSDLKSHILTGDVGNKSEGDQDLHHSSVNDCDHPAHPHHPPADKALSSSSPLLHLTVIHYSHSYALHGIWTWHLCIKRRFNPIQC